mgnify:CR=1 FL=1|jgi:hypothetical protein|tara:strand:- start:1626 stop:1790 length:165 start_codon:yes stop_codon:yes gene_type:complete
MSKNPHSEFLKYHGFQLDTPDTIPTTDVELLRAEVLEIKLTLQQVLQELRKLNT